MVAHMLRRNRKITITTSAIESTRVNFTSSTEARMVVVRSITTLTCTEGGIADCRRGNWARISSTVSRILAPGCLKMTS